MTTFEETLKKRWKIHKENSKTDIPPISFGEGVGIEIEYMIVHRKTLEILPIADKILEDIDLKYKNIKEKSIVAFSNEIVNHVIEFKGNGPVRDLEYFSEEMSKKICEVNEMLQKYEAMLLPGSMHPFMDPTKDTHIWQKEGNDIYSMYFELFDFKQHCWSNIQGVHLNIPYSNEKEYTKLTKAIRFILPLIPSLSASSPICGNEIKGEIDHRLWSQLHSRDRFTILMGDVIPEKIYTITEYEDLIFKKIDEAVALYDEEIILEPEWMNHRAVIPRFSRNCIEIKIIDSQENPALDIAICRFLELMIKGLVNNWWNSEDVGEFTTKELYEIYETSVIYGENVLIENQKYLNVFGHTEPTKMSELLMKIYKDIKLNESIEDAFDDSIKNIIERGTLSNRLINAYKESDDKCINTIYHKLAYCLEHGEMFNQ